LTAGALVLESITQNPPAVKVWRVVFVLHRSVTDRGGTSNGNTRETATTVGH